jgi:putative MFS transporter
VGIALRDRRGPLAFAVGVIAVTIGVVMHIPMFLMGREMGYRLYGMPMGPDMYVGMALIVGGAAVAAFGLLPRDISRQIAV